MGRTVKIVTVLVVALLAICQGRVAFTEKDVTNRSPNVITKNDIQTDSKEITSTMNSLDTESNNIEEIENNTIEEHDENNNGAKNDSTLPSVDKNKPLILTSMLERGFKKEAREASRVDSSLFLGFESYSGYFTVNKTYNSNVFFWYFPVENKPVNETPWIIWLQGGPGASSLVGLFEEIGPFKLGAEEKLIKNPYTWLKNHSLIFIDNPIGAGFSFTESKDGFVKDMATYSKHLFKTVQQFLQVFPELRQAPLYIAGESYAGKYVPALAMELHRHKHKPAYDVNLQGVIIGNAYIDPAMIAQVTQTYYNFGLLEKEQMDDIEPLATAFQRDIANHNSLGAKNKWINLISILLLITNQNHAYNFLKDDVTLGSCSGFLKKPEIMEALHVGNINFSFVNVTANLVMAPDFLSSTKPLFEKLLEHYRVLTYCGQLDLMLPCLYTSENYRTWKWSGASEFLKATRYPLKFNRKLAGYSKSGGRLTEVVVRGAGHMVPADAPAPAQALVARWTHRQTLAPRNPLLEGTFIHDFVANNSAVLYLYVVVGAVVVPGDTVKPALILTPYIAKNRLYEARNLSRVDPKLFLNVTSYSGFLTVDKRYNSNLFFWYFPIANRVVEDTPWIIWLQGGPGATSLVGVFDEMGPFDQPFGFKLRETSWCNDYSMLFIDNPVGAGFSFTDHKDGLPRDVETYTNHLFSALRQFLTIFPELQKAPLYIAGSSYAGRYVPALAEKISETNVNINLQGLIFGNPVFDRESIMDYSVVFYQWGLIDQQGVLEVKPLQDKYKFAILSGQSEDAALIREELLDKLQELSCQYEMYNILKDDHSELSKFIAVVTDNTVRKALHVGNLGFTLSNASLHRSLAPDFLQKVSPKIEALLENYRILIYCGQLDLIAPCVQNAAARRRSWAWSHRDRFLAAPRVPWWSHGTVAGYVKSGGNLTEVLVRGAGHLAPMDKPAEIQELVNYFIQDVEIPTPPGFRTESVPEYEELQFGDQRSEAGLIVSVIINVLLILSIIAMGLWFLSWKRKNDAVFIPLTEDIFNVA